MKGKNSSCSAAAKCWRFNKKAFSGDSEANFDRIAAYFCRLVNPMQSVCWWCVMLLSPAVCSSLATQGSEATLSSKPTVGTGSPAGPSSADDLQNSQGDDDDGLEVFEDHSGGENHGVALFGKNAKSWCKKRAIIQTLTCVELMIIEIIFLNSANCKNVIFFQLLFLRRIWSFFFSYDKNGVCSC